MRHPVGCGQVVHTVDFHLDETSGVVEIPDALKARFACHLMLTQLPDRGLSEALGSLSQIYLFYRALAVPQPVLPALERVQARYGETVTAPVYPISEE
jgi:hypothetical protein